MTKVAIFASGAGSNAATIIDYFQRSDHQISIPILFTDKVKAGIYDVASSRGKKIYCFNQNGVLNWDTVIEKLNAENIDWIVLAGFLRLIPIRLIESYKGKMVNIHPSLLPNYGGKGMYGDHVHRSVIANGEDKSGITIHYVSEKYDEGEVIFQKECPVYKDDKVENLRNRIRNLEHTFFPKVLEEIILRDEN